MFIKAWLIDNKEGLYNCQGCLTFEPIFSKDYLIRVAESMWKLCTTIMNPGFFSYETLASDLRDPNIARVISAVHRICIIIGKGNSIWAGVSNWKWGNPEKKDSESEKSKKCIPLTKCEVIESIKNLDVPTIE